MGKKNIEREVRELIGEEEPLSVLRGFKEEEAYRLECRKYHFYEPNGKCEQFIKKVGEGEHFVVLFSAANGVGKTAAGANIIAHICFESENQYFNYPLFKNWPYPKQGRIASDPTNIGKNLIPALKEWLPEGRYKTRKGRKDYESIWTTDNGWGFDIMTYDQDAKEFEGATLGWAWFDEPPPEAIFKATVARMRKGGVIFISATPLKGSAWMYDHIIAQPEKDLALMGQRCYIEADVEDACKQHGVRGHLEHNHILQMIAEYSEDERQARVHGKFQHLVGLRFKAFSRNIHVIKPFEINLKDYCVYEALDTHPRENDMATWLAVDRKGRKYIIDELWLKCQGGTEELAQRIKDKAQQYRVVRRLLEPAAFIEDQHTEKCLARTLVEYGLHYLKASKMRTQSDRRIEDALSFQQLGGSEEFIKAPEFYIFDICVRHIFEFEHYSWDDWTGKIAEKKGQKEKTIDKDDHAIENVGRILIQEPVFIPPPEKRQQDEDTNYDPFD